MSSTFALIIIVGVTGFAAAADLGPTAPVKPAAVSTPNVPGERQGGDTVETAFPIPDLPYSATGTTIGFTNDYDIECPWGGSTSPDVCYAYTPAHDVLIDVDFCHSSYDTKAYIFDSHYDIVACNDDAYFEPPCFVYSSRIDRASLAAGETYTIVIDGYSGAAGAFVMDVMEFVPCHLDCPAGAVAEGEPPLDDDYYDTWNSGCNDAGLAFQSLVGDVGGSLAFCGHAGWYGTSGITIRDTDWFILTMGPTGTIEVTMDAEWETYMFEIGPQNCDDVAVIQQAIAGRCSTADLTITGYAPDAVVWFWAGSTMFQPPAGFDSEYIYVASFTGLAPGAVATEAATWSTLKAMWE